MNKVFPTMYSRPPKGMLFAIIAYWFIGFVMVPMWMPFMGLGLWEKPELIAWLEIAYHVMNAAAMAMMLKECLEEGWFLMTTDWQGTLKYIGLTIGLMLAVLVQQIATLFVWGYPISYCFNGLPVVEKCVSLTPYYLAEVRPVFGTISMVICSPIAVCGLFYALGFAPLCVKEKPVLAYLNVALITAIPAVIDILWRQEIELNIIIYMMHLPAHLIACWSYQKTDNVWTPLVSLAVVNLLTSMVAVFL